MADFKPCRECGKECSADAYMCPHCGAPYPARPKWDGIGFEYKSERTLFGLPLVHISFKYKDRKPVVAKGIISIGQFGFGVISISQFGFGLIAVHQLGFGGVSLGQITAAITGMAQFGLFLVRGIGQKIFCLFC